jgi:hypothetical protein
MYEGLNIALHVFYVHVVGYDSHRLQRTDTV